jgi:hypothetical protein
MQRQMSIPVRVQGKKEKQKTRMARFVLEASKRGRLHDLLLGVYRKAQGCTE